MSDVPLVSVVSAFYNRAGRVAESIGSVLAQDYPALEVIVVDDGSRDDTVGELRKIADSRLTIIHRENRGFVASMNEAIAASRGAFVAVHGSGDLSLPGRIARQAKILTEQAEVSVVGCWVDNEETGGAGSRTFKPPRGLDFHKTLLSRGLFTHGEVMFRRSHFDAVGGYRDFFRFAQDRDLWLRMSRLGGYEIVPEILYRRYKPEGGVSADPEKLLLQAYLSDFAVQCARIVDAGGRDPIDRHGGAAAFLRTPSPMFARKLAWFGARMMVEGDVAQGWLIVERAHREHPGRQVRMIRALAALHDRPALWARIGRPVLARRLRQFREGH
ncbi:glycosyltransferase [Sphingomonas yantingensis]|uniref:Glycosyltransferase involved in cell wall biosynthesis n=1 Tax=Sphingomonas yantingensis TaxID=1241761 RepID=A0A7W9EIM6_9SPHN|nr:glycosyltransferase [Sphingomonas yantingensis]MBB5699299.1 glycosyltransferase involved in cell wall biosynthesis [Sphingomonas yantingensis]